MTTSRLAVRAMIVLSTVVLAGASAQAPQSKLVYPGPDGKLLYTPDERGNVIPDFSHCGYMGGGVRLPAPAVKITLKAGDGNADDLPRVQAAIDEAAKLPPGADRFRGAVLLKRGAYRLHGSLRMAVSGVVLRGEGDGESGTVLLATLPKQHSVIVVGGEGAATE